MDYIKARLETGNVDHSKRALQHLCKLYREGYRIGGDQLVGVEQSIVGLLSTQAKDEKVRRWALNAIAQLGREQFCLTVVLDVLKRYSHEPQTAAAAIAGIFRLTRKPEEVLARMDLFDPQMITLAALQHVEPSKLNLSSLPVNIEISTADQLKLGLLVVGLDRAPLNLFHPKYDNAQIVRVLGQHDDAIVSQYTIWAIAENPSLGLRDLGVDIRSVEQLPPNVRSWIFRLIGMSRGDAEGNREYIEVGMRDPETEARVGLAMGLRDTFFDGLDPLVLDWLTSEPDQEVRHTLLDHLVKQAGRSAAYESMVLQLYEAEAIGTPLQLRMEASAAGTPIFSKFRKISYDGTADLFRQGPIVNNNTINIGTMTGGAVAIGGDAVNSGTTNAHYNAQTIGAIQSELSKALLELRVLQIDDSLRQQALKELEQAQADPTPDKIKKALDVLAQVEAAASKVKGVVTSIAAIGAAIGKIAGFL